MNKAITYVRRACPISYVRRPLHASNVVEVRWVWRYDVYKCPIIPGISGDDNSIALFLSLFIISYTYHMSFKRVFLTCHKCSKDCIGKYRDDDGNPLCGTCIPNSQRSRMVSCSKCNSGHHDTTGTNICRKCRSMEAQRSPNVRLCPTCGGRINSKLETMTECMKCMGKPKYWRLLRASKKQET